MLEKKKSANVSKLLSSSTEAVSLRYSVKKVFFNKVTCVKPSTVLKRDFDKVFFCEFCEIFKNIFFSKTPPLAASAPKILEEYRTSWSNCLKSKKYNSDKK